MSEQRTRRREAPEYTAWIHLRLRCFNPKNSRYKNYGGRGITVCDRWNSSYQAFLEDMGPRPSPGHSIDRIDNDGNYEPSNCRWATSAQQRANQMRSRRVFYRGEQMTLAEAVAKAGNVVYYSLAWPRIFRRGWSVELAVETPTEGRGRGDKSPVAKLTTETALAILASPLSAAKIAKLCGVSTSAADHVRSGRTWKHLREAT